MVARNNSGPGLLTRAVLACLLLTPGLFAQAQFCVDCLDVSLESDVVAATGTRVRVSITAGALANRPADRYLALVKPDNSLGILDKLSDWRVMDYRDELTLTPDAGRFGQYRVYLVLTAPGADPLDTGAWLAGTSREFAYLPAVTGPAVPGASSPVLGKLILHGGGEYRGQRVTNALQAFDNAYARGRRQFEIDLSWTADGHLVLVHDWAEAYRRLFADFTHVPDQATFLSQPMRQALTQLGLDEFLAWLEAHRDVWVITDIKSDNLRGLADLKARAGELQARILPQIYSVREYEPVRELGFERIILTLYRTGMEDGAVLEFARQNALAGVTLPVNRALSTSLAAELATAGVPVFAHTVNQAALADLLQNIGVWGVYTDSLFSLEE